MPQEIKNRVYPEQYARTFTPLRDELKQALELAVPRFGHSPRIAFMKLNDACQKDCYYCDANIIKGKQLSTPQVFNVLNNLAQAGIQMVDLSGGEPTLRKDLKEIVVHSKKLGMITTISTNGGVDRGLENDYNYWSSLAEAGLFGASFSYDGVGEKADPRVVHLASFLSNKLHILATIKTVVWQENLDKVFDIAKMAILNNIFFQALPAVAIGGETSAKPTEFTPLTFEERIKFVEIINQASKIRGPFADFLRIPKRYLKQVISSPDPNSWHCKNPASHWISVDAQGRARICNERPIKGKTFLLTGEENPLLDADFAKKVNTQVEECRGCSWLCHWQDNMGQLERGLDQLRLLVTITAFT